MNIVNDLTLNMSNNKEYIEIGWKHNIKLTAEGIYNENLSPLGTYYLKLLNNSELITNLLNNTINSLNQVEYIKSPVYDLEKELNVIDKTLSRFITAKLMNFIDIKQRRYNELSKEIQKLNENISKHTQMLSNKELLNSYFDNQLDNWNKSIKEKKIIIEEDKNEFLNTFFPTSYNDRYTYIEKLLDEELTVNELSKNELVSLSIDKQKDYLIKEIQANYISILENHIEKINYRYNLDTQNLTINEFNFLYDSVIELPKNTRYFCYIEGHYIKSFKTIYEKLLTHNGDKKEYLIKLINNLKSPIIFNSFEINDLDNLLNTYYNYFIDNNIIIRKCENCGKYFIPTTRNDEKYCNNIFTNNLTCKEYAPKYKYRKSINNDEIKKAHYNLSQNFRMKIKRAKTLQEKEKLIKLFENYKQNYEKQKDKYKNKNLSEEDFINWIIEQKHI